MSELAAVGTELAKCKSDYVRFNETILGRGGYWARQRDIAASIFQHPQTLVPTGNMVGKTFADAGLILAFLLTHPQSLVLFTAPSQTQLEEVLWKEVERAYHGSRIPLGGRLLQSPLKVDLGDGWEALGYSTTKVERFSGHHAPELLAVGDEASGIADPIFEAIASLGASRELWTGNPLRPDGVFYDRCTRAATNPAGPARLIHISSLESPHIHLERSPWGLADATWLAKSRNDYGEGSLWWTCHVLGLFPDSGVDTLIPVSWLDRAGAAADDAVYRGGPVRTAVDLGLGTGGDRSVVLTRDDNSILDLQHGRTWTLEATAGIVSRHVQRWGVEPCHISFDATGIGADFANRLQALGLHGCQPYRGGGGGGKKFGNLRTAAAWRLRQRLDPARLDAQRQTPPPFQIRSDWLSMMRAELQGLRYTQDEKGRVALETKEDFAERLHHSPDFADTLGQSFAFPG